MEVAAESAGRTARLNLLCPEGILAGILRVTSKAAAPRPGIKPPRLPSNEIIMKPTLKRISQLVVTGILFAGLTAAATAKGAGNTSTNIPAKATFYGSITAPGTQTIYADLYGYYYDGAYLDSSNVTVTGASYVSGNSYFFRTVTSSGTAATNIRGVYLDFTNVVPGSGTPPSSVSDPNDTSGAVLHLGDTTSLNFIPDLRILANGLFGASATTSVIMPFSLQTEFSGSADFELDFVAAVPISVLDANTRVLTASNAVAELYVIRKGKKSLVGKYYMSFSLTVAKG